MEYAAEIVTITFKMKLPFYDSTLKHDCLTLSPWVGGDVSAFVFEVVEYDG